MNNRYNTIKSMLDKLDFINNEKFSSNDFNDLNHALEIEINNLRSNSLNVSDSVASECEKDVILKIIDKIENLEAKIVPKAELIRNFSNSRI